MSMSGQSEKMRVLFLSDHLGYANGVVHGATVYFLNVLPRLRGRYKIGPLEVTHTDLDLPTAMTVVAALVPADHLRNWPEIIETATNYAASLGVTSVQDMHSDELADCALGAVAGQIASYLGQAKMNRRGGKLRLRVRPAHERLRRPAARGLRVAGLDALRLRQWIAPFDDNRHSLTP
jgi:hypothetical protein